MSPYFVLNLPVEFGWVLLSAVLMGLSCIVVGFIFAGGARGKVFTEQYLKENYGTEHKRVTGQEIKKGGYPDTGSGFYTRNLDYEQWYTLNNGQRAHMNYVEWIGTNLIFHVVAGIYFPIPAAILGFGIIISRFVYAIGYTQGGPNSRILGALANDLITLAELILAIISCVKFMQGVQAS